MTRQRMFLDMSCVDAARERIRHVYDTFDTVCVQFSGGKDSTAALYLAKEIHEERGLGPVKAIFRDEEMLLPSVAKFVEEVYNYDWVDMEWYCLPQGSNVWVLGRREYVLMWSPMRARQGRLVREMPPWAIRAEHFGLDPAQSLPESIDYYTMQGKQGRVAFITGVRANESMIRYRSCVQKLHENYIVTPFRMKKSIPLKFAKIIYDWTTADVMKFLIEEHNAPYCEYYDTAAISGSNARVGIPLHSVAIRRIGDVLATEPEFYDTLVRCFPHIDAQRKLWSQINVDALIDSYSDDWNGVRRCIEENMLTPGLKQHAMKFAAEYRKKWATDEWSYPIEWCIRQLLLNEFAVTSASPVGPKTRAYTRRLAAQAAFEEQQQQEANSLDAQDDFR
jgi:3'-phosphoadenosine 5'-phosphosulfate sulfotransferase (PAPS reductase)/FAD synthetase